jgi:hypothetical protein
MPDLAHMVKGERESGETIKPVRLSAPARYGTA